MPELAVSDIARSEAPLRGTSAHRSGYTPLLMSEEEVSALDPKALEQKQHEEDEELSVLSKIASLTDHPGYQKMREARLKTIEHYRSGDFAKVALTDASIDDAHFGQLMRVGMLVADELDKELKTVEMAAQAVEDEKTRRNARRRQKAD